MCELRARTMHTTLVVDLVRARMHRVLLLASSIFCCCLIGLRDPALRESFFSGWVRLEYGQESVVIDQLLGNEKKMRE